MNVNDTNNQHKMKLKRLKEHRVKFAIDKNGLASHIEHC